MKKEATDMDFNWVRDQARKFRKEACNLANAAESANEDYRQEQSEENQWEATAAGNKLSSLFDVVWEMLYAGGFQSEYNRVADMLVSFVKFDTDIDIRIFAH